MCKLPLDQLQNNLLRNVMKVTSIVLLRSTLPNSIALHDHGQSMPFAFTFYKVNIQALGVGRKWLAKGTLMLHDLKKCRRS